MRYQNVCLEAFGYVLPAEIITSEQIEAQLNPLYERLRLPQGRLELISGVRSRRVWERQTRLAQISAQSARHALEAAEFDPQDVGALIHASVCRDYLEPATASFVHQALELPARCTIFDLSNACLGFLNGMVQVANMIELGQIRSGIVVSTESCRAVVESTIAMLNEDQSLSRKSIKSAIASLTLGSASVACVLVDRRWSRTGNRLHTASLLASTDHVALCRGGDQQQDTSAGILMETDSEQLLEAGVEAATRAFPTFLDEAAWERTQIDYTFCHQVGGVHRKRMLDELGLDAETDYSTFEYLGNTGSAALPITAALAMEQDRVAAGSQVAMLGIGSGINVLMAGVEWQRSLVQGTDPHAGTDQQALDRAKPTGTVAAPHIAPSLATQPSSKQKQISVGS